MDRGQRIHCTGLIGCKIHKHIHVKRVNNSQHGYGQSYDKH